MMRSARRKQERGSALVTSFVLMSMMAIGAAAFFTSATQSVRISARSGYEIQTTHLCEAGAQSVLRSLWRPFKTTQNFTNLDSVASGASASNPLGAVAGSVPGVGRFSAGVISSVTPTGDTYSRVVTIRCVGWVDLVGNGVLDASEPQRSVDVIATFTLDRSPVFDYTYFVNNYGWMNGFDPSTLIVNGDMRANGNFDFLNGSPTINGSVFATANDKLATAAAGLVNAQPVKWSNTTYASQASSAASGAVDNEARWRQGYNSTVHGARGSSTYDSWRESIFDSQGGIVNGRLAGAVLGDSTGLDGWVRETVGASAAVTAVDSTPTHEIIMPDLSDLSVYQAASAAYRDPKATFADGTANADYGAVAYVEVYNSTTRAYTRISTGGVVTGSAVLVGTTANPVRIHGPVTFTQDVLIKGTVSGRGTLYSGRNVHIVGSIIYKNKPDFRGTNQTTIDRANEKDDLVALAARGSVIMGDTTSFTNSSPLQYMTPPFTKGRYDDNGNWVAPFNALDTDSSGTLKYKSVLGDSTMRSVAESVNQIDAVLYTNFVGGGNIGAAGTGVKFNGSIISRDEAMVVWSTPMYLNYDNRIKERGISSQPLIDINLPRSPTLLRSAWRDRGFTYQQ